MSDQGGDPTGLWVVLLTLALLILTVALVVIGVKTYRYMKRTERQKVASAAAATPLPDMEVTSGPGSLTGHLETWTRADGAPSLTVVRDFRRIYLTNHGPGIARDVRVHVAGNGGKREQERRLGNLGDGVNTNAEMEVTTTSDEPALPRVWVSWKEQPGAIVREHDVTW